MHIFRHFIIWFVTIGWIVGLELIKKRPEFWWLILSIFVLLILAAVWYLSKSRFKTVQSIKIFLHFIIIPLSLIASSFSLAVILVNDIIFHLMAVFSGLILYVLLKQYYLYFNLPFKYQPYSLESLSWYFGLICVFFISTAGFSGLILLQFNIGIIILIVMTFVGFLAYQFFWIHKISWSKSWLLILIILLILTELFVAVSYLPTSHYVNGLILAVAYYLMVGLAKLDLLETLNKKRVVSYLVVAGIVLLAVLLTAQWE